MEPVTKVLLVWGRDPGDGSQALLSVCGTNEGADVAGRQWTSWGWQLVHVEEREVEDAH